MAVTQVFIYLQLLDLLTTLVGFKMGAGEASPFIRLLMQAGPATGVAISKLIALALGGLCLYLKKQHLIRWATYWYGALVVWNLMVMLVGPGPARVRTAYDAGRSSSVFQVLTPVFMPLASGRTTSRPSDSISTAYIGRSLVLNDAIADLEIERLAVVRRDNRITRDRRAPETASSKARNSHNCSSGRRTRGRSYAPTGFVRSA